MEEDYPKTLMELEQRFPDEASCRDYLFSLRWPNGFVCSSCGHLHGIQIRRGLWRCSSCRHETSVMAGTVFQDSKLPLTVWFRAMWQVTSQKNGISALGLQRVLGLGSYKTAWAMLHKLRLAMVRPGRERLSGIIEVDETYWGTEESGVHGRETLDKSLIVIAAEVAPGPENTIGRIRLRRIDDVKRKTLHDFIEDAIEPGSTVITDGLQGYRNMTGYIHQRYVRRKQTADVEEELLPRAHRVASLLKRWLMGTHQGSVSEEHLNAYLNEFTFRFNRRTSKSRGKLFYRLAQQAVQVKPAVFRSITHNR